MSRLWSSAIYLMALLLPLAGFAAEQPTKVGIVKGVITVAGRPTADAVASVEGIAQEKVKSQKSKVKTAKAVIDQRDMKFIPRVLAVIAGTEVEFPNNDKTFHNVYSTSEAKKFDLGLYAPGKSRSAKFDKPGVAKILCNAHPNMEAYVVVKSHPYYSGTDSRGNYSVSGVPLGKYRLEVWHPDFGVKVVPFELVRAGEVLALDVEMKK
jgi:plastocyanin